MPMTITPEQDQYLRDRYIEGGRCLQGDGRYAMSQGRVLVPFPLLLETHRDETDYVDEIGLTQEHIDVSVAQWHSRERCVYCGKLGGTGSWDCCGLGEID